MQKVKANFFTTDKKLDLSLKNSNRYQVIADLKQEYNMPTEPCWLQQEHGNKVIIAENYQEDFSKQNYPVADAMVSFVPGTVCAVLTADCMPILLYSDIGECVAAIHAGWRSLQSGIIENTIALLKQNNINLNYVHAWIGPSISQAKFEVGEDVIALFFPKRGRVPNRNNNGKYLFDFKSLAKAELIEMGVPEDNIIDSKICSFTEVALCHSHRRDKTLKRMASFVWLH